MTKPEFDVFLSHNSKDKATVRQLAEALQERGLKVWLDEWQLVPGRPGQTALEEIIAATKSAVVLVGKDGLGPWEEPEMRACLSQFVKREMPVIPVLLPGASILTTGYGSGNDPGLLWMRTLRVTVRSVISLWNWQT